RGDKICGNPCPVCRDPNIIIHHQNVKLLQQFISPHTGMVYDPTLTGVCMKQQKKLNEAIDKARDDGMKFEASMKLCIKYFRNHGTIWPQFSNIFNCL
ncbi:hypothetical protein ILYODFUR_033675, partial [Ilyodon furcidens]